MLNDVLASTLSKILNAEKRSKTEGEKQDKHRLFADKQMPLADTYLTMK